MIDNEYSKIFEVITGLQFDSFYRQHRPKLIWYLAKYTKNNEKAEDFADEAFMQALIKINSYNNEKSQIHTWVYKIGENIVKKEYKDSKRLKLCSLDTNNSTEGNLTLSNIIPYKDTHEKLEKELILEKKAEMIKKSILKLPKKYKKVMYLREIEKKPYLEITETCTKDHDIDITNGDEIMPNIIDFLEIEIENLGDNISLITFIYDNGKILQMDINPHDLFHFERSELNNITEIKLTANSHLIGKYKAITNLSTIKSQISKGRKLIQAMVKREFALLDHNGINNVNIIN